MILKLYILLGVILISVFNFCVIKSYTDIKFKKYWHYVQFSIVVLVGIVLYYLTRDYKYTLAFYGAYYVLFEPVLNKARGYKLTYLSKDKDAPFSDRIRLKVFGKYQPIIETSLRIGILISLIIL